MSSYPIHNKLKEELIEAGVPIDQMPYKAMLEALGEYEHGSVDIEDAFEDVHPAPWMIIGNDDQRRHVLLKAYAAVVADCCLTVHCYEEA